MVVEEVEVTHAQARARIVKINLDSLALHRDHPENVVSIDVYVVVVNLFREVCRSNRTGVQVKSNEGERASVLAAVRADESASTEPHVRLECQRRRGACRSVCSGPAATDVGQTHEPLEVCDLRRIADIGEGRARLQRVVVDENSEGFKSRDAARNRVGTDAFGGFAVVIVVTGVGQL